MKLGNWISRIGCDFELSFVVGSIVAEIDDREISRCLGCDSFRTCLDFRRPAKTVPAGTYRDGNVVLLDVDKSKFAPVTNVPAHVVNNAAPADVETVIIDGEIAMQNGPPMTMDSEAVQRRREAAVERFADETGWKLHVGGGEPPGSAETIGESPKRGPARLLSRLALQSVRDKFPF